MNLLQDIEICVGGKPLHGVTSMTISGKPDEVIRVKLELFTTSIDFEGTETCFVMEHPITGEIIEIAKVILKDGTLMDFRGQIEE